MKKFIYIYLFFIINNTISLDNYNEYFDYFHEKNDETYTNISIFFEDKNEMEYNIDPTKSYAFSILSENFRYSFSTDLKYKNILFFYDSNNNLVPAYNGTYFELGEKIYFFNNQSLTETIQIKVFSIPQYSKLNGFETIDENQYFFIKVKEESIAYFDSVDRNSKIYISNNTEKKITIDDIKIKGKFIPIHPNITYFLKNELYENTVSVFKKYLYPLDLTKETIYIDETFNYLYLKANSIYNLNFEKNNKILGMMLSQKTPNSIINIKSGDNIYSLNKDDPTLDYFKRHKLILNVNEYDCFIEFRTVLQKNDIHFFDGLDEKINSTTINKNIITIDIIKTYKNFNLTLESKNGDTFNYSLSFGLSIERDDDDDKIIYMSSSNRKINSKKGKIQLSFSDLFKDFLFLDYYISFSIFIDKKEGQYINISYEFYSNLHLDNDIFYFAYQKTYYKYEEIKNYFSYLFNIYIYTDIALNPPKMPELPHEKINLFEKFDLINFEDNRTFYELYRDLKQLTCLTKDLHFNFQSTKLKYYKAYLPFQFKVKKDNNEYKIFIEKNYYFEGFKDIKAKEFIESHLDIPLKKINDIEPFDYIQNWSQFLSVKNVHAQFSFIIDKIPEFDLSQFPIYIWDLLSNEYEFEDYQILKISYNIEKIKSNSQFNSYLMNNIKTNRYLFETSSLGKIKTKLKNEEKINWDYKIEDEEFGDYLKCRIDTKNKVNVFVQNSFNMKYSESIRTILNCARLFYSNDFPIIIIESKNYGGNPTLAKIMIQVFQIINVERSYNSYRASYKYYFEKTETNLIDPETCEIINETKTLAEESDFYKYDNLEVEHKRTKRMQEINLQTRKALNNFREEFKNSPFLKKPTDIIIFTDAFSFSATSTLIKGFQNIGGAIIVGYFGNPKIEGKDLFDSSQSDSSIKEIEKDKIDYFETSITTQEIFDDYKDENPIPREYTFNKVDYRVDIYSKYSDDIYSDFIKEGQEIFNKFKDENYCNSKNQKIMIPDEKCENLGEYLHGGYKCKKEKDEWDKEHCIPYYCDIGYYFDKYKQKCIKECTYKNEVFYIYEKDYEKEFNIQRNETYEFFTYNPEDNYYVFQASENYFYRELSKINQSRIYFHRPTHENDYITINRNKNANNIINIKINTTKINFDLTQIKTDQIIDKKIIQNGKKVIIFEGYFDNIFYLKKILNNEIKYAKFKDEMSYEDIININNKYFTDYKEDILTFDKNEVYIIYFDNNNYEKNIIQFFIWQEESDRPDKSILLNDEKNYLYLKKGSTYKFEINTKFNILLKLSRKTLNSEINLNYENIILNKNNLYYNITNNKEFKLNINNEDGFMEILYNYIDSKEELEYKELEFEKSEFNLSKTLNIIKIPKNNYTNKIINLEIIGNNKSEYLIYHDYTIFPYFHKYGEETSITLSKCNFTIMDPYPNSIKLMENEFYYVMITKKDNKELKLYITIENKSEEDDDELSGWEIALIIIFIAIILLFIIILLFCCIRSKKDLSSKQLEKKLNDVEEIKELM